MLYNSCYQWKQLLLQDLYIYKMTFNREHIQRASLDWYRELICTICSSDLDFNNEWNIPSNVVEYIISFTVFSAKVRKYYIWIQKMVLFGFSSCTAYPSMHSWYPVMTWINTNSLENYQYSSYSKSISSDRHKQYLFYVRVNLYSSQLIAISRNQRNQINRNNKHLLNYDRMRFSKQYVWIHSKCFFLRIMI